MRLSRRGLILGGSALLAGCSSAASTVQLAGAAPASLPVVPVPTVTPQTVSVARATGPAIDPHGIVRKDLMERAQAALDTHGHKISKRDRMYLVDFKKFSGEDRFYEVDLEGGWVTAYRTSHGRGSDPAHSGFAQRFSNQMDSHMSSIGAYATAGASWGSQQGPNVLLDGLEYSSPSSRTFGPCCDPQLAPAVA